MKTTTLTIDGTIKLEQFWPKGSSDADTTKLVLTVSKESFRVRRPGERAAKVTHAYEGAVVKVNGVDKSLIKNNTITVRLQRIDAPELHVRPKSIAIDKKTGEFGSLANTGLIKDFRQRQAETAVLRLAKFLESRGGSEIACTFTTQLDPAEGPGAAIDAYGRFVGDIMLSTTNLNLWLLEQGLAVVALYNSMQNFEIVESLDAWHKGQRAREGIVRFYRSTFGQFEALEFRKAGSRISNEAGGRFIHPKFFRRQCTWWAYREAKKYGGSFANFLQHQAEKCFHMDDFLVKRNAAPKQLLFDKKTDGNGIAWPPETFIFIESPSKIERVTASGRVKIVSW
jgi:endonuclease YncB( thermonuclease family)